MKARLLCIEYAGALYHVSARGNAPANIDGNDDDRYDWYCYAYRLMDNRYHLLIETNRASLSDGMKFLIGSYTQIMNLRTHLSDIQTFALFY